MTYPLKFHPIFKERVWGGRRLQALYQKPLPADKPIGESWEVSDRPGDANVIANGPWRGKDLRWVMEHHAAEIMGEANSLKGRFPLLIKILDAQETLSLQVHPPASLAEKLNGEPKTEMWFVTQADPGAELFAGLKSGVTRDDFEKRLSNGSVAECFHRIKIRPGDAMFVPSGRVHAIGKGSVLFEVQQNSDTTYRVFDWNRAGLDGKPRELHVAESLASIDFTDFEPGLRPAGWTNHAAFRERSLADCAYFSVDLYEAKRAHEFTLASPKPEIVAVLDGNTTIQWADGEIRSQPGDFTLLPAAAPEAILSANGACSFLRIQTK